MPIAYTEDIERLQYKFTELGEAIAEVSKLHSGYFDDTVKTLADGFDNLKEVYTSGALDNVFGTAGMLSTHVASLSTLFSKTLGGASDSFSALMQSSSGAQQGIETISNALDKAAKQGSGSKGGSDKVDGSTDVKTLKSAKSRLPRIVQQELGSAKSGINSMLGKLRLPKPGHVAATGLAVMAYGFIYRDRVRAEAGEIKNTLESAFDYGLKSVRQKGVRTFSAMQENLQRYSGIAKSEVQAITSAFASGGVGIEEMLRRTGEGLGRIGKNSVHATLALDKMFGVAGGTHAQKAISYMHNYGMSLEEANDMTRDLTLNDKAFEIGVPTFVQNVETAADSLKEFGFSIRGVMNVAGELQTSFEKIGIPKQFAGKLAGMGVREMAQGIAGLSDDWKVLMGQRMNPGKTGLEALQTFEESFTRVKSGGGVEDYNKLISEMYKLAQETSEGDESQMYAFLSRNVGLGSKGARAVMEIGKVMEEKGGVDALKATEKHMVTLKDAFQTEKEKDSQFKREMNKWMEGMADIGRGLLGIVGKFLAHLVAMFRAYPHMLSALVSLDFDRLKRIQTKIAGLNVGMSKDIAFLKQGVGKLKGAGKELFGDIFKSSIGSMEQAFSADFSGADIPKSSDRPTTLSPDRAPILQPVYIPVGSGEAGGPSGGGTYPVGMQPGVEEAASSVAANLGTYWVGGGLSINSHGVDEHGNIGLEIVGNCPRCGLLFGGGASGDQGNEPPGAAKGGAFTSMGLEGEGKYSGQDVEAAMRVLTSEQGGVFGGGSKRWEALGILQSMKNRAKSRKQSLYDVATGGSGWGKQGKGKRQYGTARGGKQNKGLEKFVRSFLRGEIEAPDELKNARGFWHNRPGQQWTKGDYKGATPYFARKDGGQGILGSRKVGPKSSIFFTGGKSDTAEGAAARARLESAQGAKSKAPSIEKSSTEDQWMDDELARGSFYTGAE